MSDFLKEVLLPPNINLLNCYIVAFTEADDIEINFTTLLPSSPDHLVYECLLLTHQTPLESGDPAVSVEGTRVVFPPLGVGMEGDILVMQYLEHPLDSGRQRHQ